jgi:hypothetical protein
MIINIIQLALRRLVKLKLFDHAIERATTMHHTA